MKNISIVIPIHNEEAHVKGLLLSLVCALKDQLPRLGYEIILVENGSIDKTKRIARAMEAKLPYLSVVSLDHANYGQALKAGIFSAKYPVVFLANIEFWDVHFLKKAIQKLKNHDIVIGSKNLKNSKDGRTFCRKILSRLTELVLQTRFKSNITDTHGLKVIKKEKVLSFIPDVKSENHFFDTELLLRCEQDGVSMCELPVKLVEIRKSRFPTLLRSFQAASELTALIIPVHKLFYIANKALSPVYSLFI
jgi:glycosyltransferase involved in cell wall biosynthesis